MDARRELLPLGGTRKERTAEQIAQAKSSRFDYPAIRIGVAGNVTVYYATSLGDQGAALGAQMLNAALKPYNDLQTLFGIAGAAVNVIIAPLSGKNDGSGGAYHMGCDFGSGADLHLDATFAAAPADPLNLEIGLYVAELSESFMGPQNKGWGCGFSNGEALSRFCAEQATPPDTLNGFATGPAWDRAGRPDWISRTEQTDRDDISTGCGIVYIYWLRSLGFAASRIAQAGGATLSANYQAVTGKTSAYEDLLAALKGVAITTDNPFSS